MNPKDSFEVFYNKSLRFLSFRPRSENEVRNYLLRHSGKPKAHPESKGRGDDSGQARMTVINQIIAKLKCQNFINDEEFTRWWIGQRKEFKPRSEKLIKMELRQKGISEEIIAAIQSSRLDSAAKRAEFRVQNDLEQAKRLAQKRIQRYKGLEKKELYEKLGPFLARRGFDFETIKQSIDEVLNKGV